MTDQHKTPRLIDLNSWNDLRPLGIDALTGEADAFCLRLLCDVNEDGRDAISEYFGMDLRNGGLRDAWNGSLINGKERVGSILLNRDLSEHLALLYILARNAGYPHIVVYRRRFVDKNEVTYEDWDKDWDKPGSILAYRTEEGLRAAQEEFSVKCLLTYGANMAIPSIEINKHILTTKTVGGGRNRHAFSGRVA